MYLDPRILIFWELFPLYEIYVDLRMVYWVSRILFPVVLQPLSFFSPSALPLLFLRTWIEPGITQPDLRIQLLLYRHFALRGMTQLCFDTYYDST